MALDTTIGGTSSDSYGTLAEYEAYIVANIDANFNGHGHDSTHEIHLRRAAQYLDRKYSFIGMKQYQFQARSWPRLVNVLVDDWPIDPDTIPQDIIHAQFELAYLFEEQNLDPFATDTTGAVKSTTLKAGSVSKQVEYLGPRATPRIVAVEGLLRDYIGGGGVGQVRMARG